MPFPRWRTSPVVGRSSMRLFQPRISCGVRRSSTASGRTVIYGRYFREGIIRAGKEGNDVDTDLPASAYAPFRAWSGLDARGASGRRGCHRTLDQWIFRETTLAVACTAGAITFGGVAYGYCPSIGDVRCLLGRQPLDQDGLGQVLGPSQTTIRQSWMPRFWISDRTRSQYFAPSPSLCSPAHSPRMSLVPSEVTASAR